MPDVSIGHHGVARCSWDYPAEYRWYHDDEWGRPVVDDRRIYEKLCLEGFQSGLSWLTILRKRVAFRDAFAGFRIDEVAGFGSPDVARLMADERIVRNRRKILATIENARAAASLRAADGSLSALVWSHRPSQHRAPRSAADLPASTPESAALAKELKARGFGFVGPTTAYALMQACGLVNDHLAGCDARPAVTEAQRKAATRRARTS